MFIIANANHYHYIFMKTANTTLFPNQPIVNKLNYNHYWLFALLFISQVAHGITPSDAKELRQMTQLAEYIAADYSEAVENGQVINQGEYLEMLDFSNILLDNSSKREQLGTNFSKIKSHSKILKNAIQNKHELGIIKDQVSIIRNLLIASMPEIKLPTAVIDSDKIKSIYLNQCTGCHGVSGAGDGSLSSNLNPKPTNFLDKQRADNRSILGLFDAISNGIDDTAMQAFDNLSENERWSLAFYVGSLAYETDEEIENDHKSDLTLNDFVNYSPEKLSSLNINKIEWYRNNPDYFFNNTEDSFSIARTQLLSSLNAYENQNIDQASTLAVSAYLDGFELIENSLDTMDQDLRKQIEAKMMGIRQIIKTPNNNEKLNSEVYETIELLDEAKFLLSETKLSNRTLFSVSLVIILREGLEAILVIIALTMVLIRTNRRDALKYVHFGWITALLAGFGTWVVAQSLIAISGASREVMEGVAALFAAIILLYVGVWMHSKSSASQWQSYIKKHINYHLSTGSLWGIAILAFVAVYREVFETVLFYQSLLTQALGDQFRIIGSGFIAGILVLAGLAWGLVKYSIKLPISKFFSFTTYLLLALSFILMGKAIAALQEAAIVSATPMPITFQIDLLGLYSTWEGIGSQILILLAFIIIQFFPKLFKGSNISRQEQQAD